MQNLHGKTAFVTGGASGIGLGIAKALLGAGMNVVIADIRDDHLAAATAELGTPERVLPPPKSKSSDLFQNRGSGFARDERQDNNPASGFFYDAPLFLIDGFQSVIAALRINVRLRGCEKTRRGLFGKDASDY